MDPSTSPRLLSPPPAPAAQHARLDALITHSAHPGYFERLDVIRAVAILWVFVFHFGGACWGWNTPDWQARWQDSPLWIAAPGRLFSHLCANGALGVPIFFVLSGFLIHYTFCRSSNPSVGIFWLRRFGRIYPPYFVALVVLAALNGFFWTARRQDDVISHLLLIHNFRDDTLFSINGSFWSLAVEAQYYLLYPLLLRIRQTVGMPLILGTSLVVRLTLNALPGLGLISATGDAAACLTMPQRYFEWILGMYVADRLLAGRRAFNVHSSLGWLCFALAMLAGDSPWIGLATVPLISVATAIWIDHIVHAHRQPSRVERLLMPVGVVSYSLYLWHQPILTAVVVRMLRMPSAADVPMPVLMGLAFTTAAIGSALVAAGAYHLTEVPAMEWTRRLARTLQGKDKTALKAGQQDPKPHTIGRAA